GQMQRRHHAARLHLDGRSRQATAKQSRQSHRAEADAAASKECAASDVGRQWLVRRCHESTVQSTNGKSPIRRRSGINATVKSTLRQVEDLLVGFGPLGIKLG